MPRSVFRRRLPVNGRNDVKPTLRRITLILVVTALLLVACTPRQMMVRQFGLMVETGMDRLEESGDVTLVGEGLPGQITLLEAILANDPGDVRLRLLLARLYAAQGLLYLEPLVEAAAWKLPVPWREAVVPPDYDLQKAQLSRVFQKGAAHALCVLEARRPDSKAQLAKVNRIHAYLEATTLEDVPALFWYALNLGAWVNHHLDDLTAIAQAHVAERIMRRVVALQPDYYHGFAHLFLVAYYGSRPPMLGGRPEAARQHYEAYKAMAAESESLSIPLGEVYFARYCLPLQQARGAYTSRLTPIARTPIKADSGLFDALAIRRAQLYLGAEDRLFE